MLFDVQAALAEILKEPPPVATPATTATNHPETALLSRVSRLSQSQPAETEMRLAEEYDDAQERGEVATVGQRPNVAAPNVSTAADLGLRRDEIHDARRLRDAERGRDAFPYGTSPGGRPLTWTGRVVSLDAWRSLTDWERHGPRGAMWNGLTECWEGARK